MAHPLYIVWNENNQLGIPIIDEQHRGVISTINSLHYSISNGHENEVIKPVLIMLEQYTIIHFKTEKALMEKAGYPENEKHVKLHKKLVLETQKLSRDFDRTRDAEHVLKFLRDWWLDHINIEDRKYAPYMEKL